MEECDCTIAALKENEMQLENARFDQDQVLLLQTLRIIIINIIIIIMINRLKLNKEQKLKDAYN